MNKESKIVYVPEYCEGTIRTKKVYNCDKYGNQREFNHFWVNEEWYDEECDIWLELDVNIFDTKEKAYNKLIETYTEQLEAYKKFTETTQRNIDNLNNYMKSIKNGN